MFLFVGACFVTLALAGVREPEQRLLMGAQKQSANLRKKNPLTIFLFTHFEREGSRFISHTTFTLFGTVNSGEEY